MHRQPIVNPAPWGEITTKAEYTKALGRVLYEIPDPPCNECRLRTRCESLAETILYKGLDGTNGDLLTCQGFRSYEVDGQRQYKTNVNMRVDPCCTCNDDCPQRGVLRTCYTRTTSPTGGDSV